MTSGRILASQRWWIFVVSPPRDLPIAWSPGSSSSFIHYWRTALPSDPPETIRPPLDEPTSGHHTEVGHIGKTVEVLGMGNC